MFDLKPNAPAEIRGEFKPIATSVPGIQICEHLPRTANWMHRCAIVRSVNHKAGCHNTLPSYTGSEQPLDINDRSQRDTYPPSMGSVCEYLKPPGVDLPHYVALPTYLGWGFALKRPGPYGRLPRQALRPALHRVRSRHRPEAAGRPAAHVARHAALADASPGRRHDPRPARHPPHAAASSSTTSSGGWRAAAAEHLRPACGSGPSSLLTASKLKAGVRPRRRKTRGCATATAGTCSAAAP